jgi:hypothetical protein
MLGRLRRTASTRLMWAFHQAEARQRVMPVESEWLRSLAPENPSPPGDPLALLREAERETESRVRVETIARLEAEIFGVERRCEVGQ